MFTHACGKLFEQQPFFAGEPSRLLQLPAPLLEEIANEEDVKDVQGTPVLKAESEDVRVSEDSNSQPPVLTQETNNSKSESDRASELAALRKRLLEEMESDSDSDDDDGKKLKIDDSPSLSLPVLEPQLSHSPSAAASDASQEAAASESDSEVKPEEGGES